MKGGIPKIPLDPLSYSYHPKLHAWEAEIRRIMGSQRGQKKVSEISHLKKDPHNTKKLGVLRYIPVIGKAKIE
jgi:hypothetical protein